MARLTLYWYDQLSKQNRRKRFEGHAVAYRTTDAVLGEDFVEIQVDNESMVLPKKDVISVYIRK